MIYGGGGDRRARRRRGALSGALGTERLRWIGWFYSPGGGDERKRETLGVCGQGEGLKGRLGRRVEHGVNAAVAMCEIGRASCRERV